MTLRSFGRDLEFGACGKPTEGLAVCIAGVDSDSSPIARYGMVAFLAQFITFHGFKQGSETLLARQVEVQAQRAGSFGSKPIQRPDGCAEIWLDRQKMDTNCTDALRSLGQAITAGWKASMESEVNDEAPEASTSESPLVAESA